MAKPWRRSKSLVKLMSQLNMAYSGRDTTSDGAIGDAEHATRGSDHNPWVKDGDMGVVTAQDIDEDLNAPGHTLLKAIQAICRSRDKRVKYIIYEGRITEKGSDLQRWQKYSGKNSHSVHAHISVHSNKKLYDDDSPWDIGIPKTAAAEQPTVNQPEKAPAKEAANGSSTGQPTENAQPQPVPASLTVVPTDVVEVPAVSAAPSGTEPAPTAETPLQKIGNKANAAYVSFGGMVAGIIAWFSTTSGIVTLSIIGAVVVLGSAYMIINWRRQETKDRRDEQDRKDAAAREQELKIIREKHAQEVQLFTLKAAATEGMTSVMVVQPPPATELPNSDSGATA